MSIKTILFIKLLLFVTVSVFGQFHFGIIDDKDGFVYVRSNKNVSDNVIDTLKNNQIIEYFDTEDGEKWVLVEYKNCKNLGSSYVYSNRIKPIDSFEKFTLETNSSKLNTLFFNNLEVSIKLNQFDSTNHSYLFDQDNPVRNVRKIDNQDVNGIGDKLPKFEYQSITIKNKDKIFNIPPKYLKNLFEPNFHLTSAYFDSKRNRIYLQAFNSDGAYGYVVLWVIENSKVVDFIITSPF